ncbi:MAG: PHP domain-containing protein [Desulfobacteraceae bacterium]|nr:MAG: PHP domain-containing protein [Desulfobacteraceae bacterium]
MVYSNNRSIDLHIHSTASDGTFSPCEILALATKLNLAAIAITDHDTIDGSKDAIDKGIPSEIKFLTGVEISAAPPLSFSCSGSIHILGYSLRLNDPVLNQTLYTLQMARKNRNPGIIERLKNIGFDISIEEVTELAGSGQTGRPHIARLMTEKGFAGSINEAFDKYLGKGKPAYVDKYRIECDEAIKIITGAGGIPVLAHPSLINIYNDKGLEDLVAALKEMGIKGMEVYYPEHSKAQVSCYMKLAKKHKLLITGGTDFHGSLKPDISMGSGRGNFHVPYNLYENLIKLKLPGIDGKRGLQGI